MGSYFFASDNFQGTFVNFRFMMFTQTLMKKLASIFVHVRKIFNCKVSFKCRCQCISPLLRRNFENSWDFQNGSFGKITITLAEVALIQESFPNVVSKQKIKMNTRNTMVSSYHSKGRSTQKMGLVLL